MQKYSNAEDDGAALGKSNKRLSLYSPVEIAVAGIDWRSR